MEMRGDIAFNLFNMGVGLALLVVSAWAHKPLMMGIGFLFFVFAMLHLKRSLNVKLTKQDR